MPIIVGIVVIFVATMVGKAFDAVGGWPGVLLIAGAIVAGFWGLIYLRDRQEAIRQLRQKPPRIAKLTEQARALAATPREFLLHEILQEREAQRAPLFWDAFETRCQELTDAINGVNRARREAADYEEGSRQYSLYPSSVEVDVGDFEQFVPTYSEDLLQICNDALAEPTFSLVYEARRSAEESRKRTRALRRELAAIGASGEAAIGGSREMTDTADRIR